MRFLANLEPIDAFPNPKNDHFLLIPHLFQLCESSCDLHHSLDEVIDILAVHGANMNVINLIGQTPLHIAVIKRQPCHVK